MAVTTTLDRDEPRARASRDERRIAPESGRGQHGHAVPLAVIPLDMESSGPLVVLAGGYKESCHEGCGMVINALDQP